MNEREREMGKSALLTCSTHCPSVVTVRPYHLDLISWPSEVLPYDGSLLSLARVLDHYHQTDNSRNADVVFARFRQTSKMAETFKQKQQKEITIHMLGRNECAKFYFGADGVGLPLISNIVALGLSSWQRESLGGPFQEGDFSTIQMPSTLRRHRCCDGWEV